MSVPVQKIPAERSFGFLCAIIFAGAGAYGFYHGWDMATNIAWLCAATAFALIAVYLPNWLVHFNRAWFRLGELLGKIISPIVLGGIYFGLLFPFALGARICGRDALRLRRPKVSTYWLERMPRGPAPESFKNQF